eukprot:gene789-1528_t
MFAADICTCVLGICLALYIGIKGYGAQREVDFIVSAFLAGSFSLSQILPFFDPSMKLFNLIAMVLVAMGALVGGVVGTLLPKVSSGFALGVFLSLIVSMVIYGQRDLLGPFAQIATSSVVFLCCIAGAVPLTFKFEEISTAARTAFAASLAFMLSIDRVLSHALFESVADVLRMDATDSNDCYDECHVPLMIVIWVVGAVVLFVLQGYKVGYLRRFMNRNLRQYQAVATRDNKVIANQRTFSYPDTLEFNYFDPDNVPEMLKPFADCTFSSVQKLAACFGFQVDSSRNQAEHLLMMLANERRQNERSVLASAFRLHDKMFTNYKKWCDRVGTPPLFSASEAEKTHLSVVVDLLIMMLIWGEGGNLRHMPECLCWLYHKTMTEYLSLGHRTRESLYPGFYLDMVVTPIYDVVAASMKSKGDHIHKKMYDDFNEFFWSPTSLQYSHRDISPDAMEGGGPTGTHAVDAPISIAKALSASTKTYLERRSWLHPLLSFHRVFEWHVVTFYLLATTAFSLQLVWSFAFTLQIGSFVFWMINLMAILWASLEVWVIFPTSSMSGPSMFGYLLRLLAGYLILVYQTIYYHWSFRTDDPAVGSLRAHGNANFWWWQFVWLSMVSLILYFIESFFCWIPSIVSGLMCWNNDIVQAILNICYPLSQLYVGKKLHVPQLAVFGYIFFWLTLIGFKLWFGYFYIVAPVTVPTLELYDDYMNYENVPFTQTAFLMFVWWFPHFLVYLIDLSIWYTVWAAFVGGFIALVERHGAVRDTDTFRTHFMRMPFAFCQKLMPVSSVVGVAAHDDLNRKPSFVSVTGLSEMPNKVAKKASKAFGQATKKIVAKKNFSSADLSSMTLSTPDTSSSQDLDNVDKAAITEMLNVRTLRWVSFSRAWNSIIDRMRATDHLSDSERSILVFTNFDWLSKPVYLPLFQTAGCVETVLHDFKSAAQNYHKEQEPEKKILVHQRFKSSLDVTSAEAVSETWELANWLLTRLVGSVHAQDFTQMNTVISRWGSSEDIFVRLSMDGLPQIHDHVANIVGALKGAIGKRKKSPVVTPEIMAEAQNEANNHGQNGQSPSEPASKTVFKRSVSTGFLAALGDNHESNSDKSVAKTEKKGPAKFQKLQPFRKASVLQDSLRDKVREELRGLLNAIRNALRVKGGVSVEGQDLIDRITFVMSMESGFLWNDIYASLQIDELAKDIRVPGVLTKLHGLQRIRQTQVEPSSPEAKRRLNFFVNSLFMDMPTSPPSLYAKDFTCMTPFYSEDVILSKDDLEAKNSDGVSTILYLQTLYKKDWINFLERRGLSDDQHIWSKQHLQETRMWASLRAQTLFRTVEGMMYTEAAVSLLAELEQLEAPVVDLLKKLKFSYVVACQVYGQMKKNLEHKADDIEFLLDRYPNLRVAYIDSMRVNREGDMAFYSVLIKGDKISKIKEVYRVKLPGNPVLGEGKPENQNHAIIFTRGRYLQTIDMNQDGYFEEALKMRNLLEEFDTGCSILGFREHIFTGSVSSVANYMALQELSFVTLGQRVLNNPLHIRQHYGHPDLFNKLFVMTEGGVSKASRGINLSEDVFAGFNATIRGHKVSFKEYAQVGKGRDVGLQQTYKFEAKLSQGNAEQTLSRDVYRINDRLDFFRLLSFYYGGIGHYMANTMVIFTLVVVVYCMTGQALYKEEGVNGRPMKPEGLLQMLLAGMGVLQTMPLVLTLVVEKGVFSAMWDLAYMMLSGGPLYFIFHIQTKCYYFAQTLMAGGAMYRPTGRGFVIRHSPFDENYRFFAATHIYLGFELMVLLILIAVYTKSTQYPGLTWSLWMTCVSFVFSPFWFNPLSFEWNKLVEDYQIWLRWMMEKGGTSEQSWEVWWREETAYIFDLTWSWKVVLVLTRCSVWIFVGVGMAGVDIFTDNSQQEKVFSILGLFVAFLGGHWFISKLERSCSYAIRRVSSFLVSAAVVGVAIYLYAQSVQYLSLTIALYYFSAAACLMLLLLGVRGVSHVNKMHDYLVGHFIFLVLCILSLLQIGILQTWLLYHNALSAGVAIEDVLKYARKTKEKANEEADISIADLRTQLAEQQRTIRILLEERGTRDVPLPVEPVVKATVVTELEMAKRGLLSGLATNPLKNYGATAPNTESNNTTTPHSIVKSNLAPKPSKSAEKLVSNAPFVFSQPTSFPARDTKKN